MNDNPLKSLLVLKKEAADLEFKLSRLKCAIKLLEASGGKADAPRQKTRIELLKEVLREHRGGVLARMIPDLLQAKGYVPRTFGEKLNWLSPSQISPENRFFIREKGYVKPTAELLQEFASAAATTKELLKGDELL